MNGQNTLGKRQSPLPVMLHINPLENAPILKDNARIAWFVFLAAIAMTVLEGSFRKWVFPQTGAVRYALYFSKDIIFATILFLPQQSQPSAALKLFLKWLTPGCLLIALGAAFSGVRDMNPVGAVLTTRALIMLPVISWLVVTRIQGLPVRWSAGLLAVFALLNCGLGIEQNLLPRDHILNRYADAEADVVEVESGVRAAGTFAYISGLAIISTVGIWAGLVLLGGARTNWQRMGAWAALVSGFGCGLASVSRAPIAIGGAIVVGWLICYRQSISLLVRSLVVGFVCLGLAYALDLFPALAKLGEGLRERNATADDTFQQRAFGQFGETLETLRFFPMGNGYGTEQSAGQYYATGVAGFNHAESPLPRIVMETGFLGLLGYILVAAGTIVALQRAKLGVASQSQAVLLATQLFLGAMFYGNVVFNHTASAFVWMIFATVMAGTFTRSETTPASPTVIQPESKPVNRAMTWQPKSN